MTTLFSPGLPVYLLIGRFTFVGRLRLASWDAD
jgi:hypothetical protein